MNELDEINLLFYYLNGGETGTERGKQFEGPGRGLESEDSSHVPPWQPIEALG